MTVPAFVSAALSTAIMVASERITSFPVPLRPEGITEVPGSSLFVGQILSGQVLAIDALTSQTTEVVSQQTGRQAWGLWNDKDAIFVAGGGPSFGGGIPELYVYDVGTGESIAKCSPVSINSFGAFLNDVTVRGSVAYVTDSVSGKLMAVDADKALDGNCSVWEVDLPDNFDPVVQDDFGANGVVAYGDGLLVCHEIDGSVWYITNIDGNNTSPVFQEVIPDGGAPAADGLTILSDTLYVTQNFEDEIAVFSLSIEQDGNITATKIGVLTSPDFATPATSAIYDGYIYSTNSRFEDLPDIAAEANDTVVAVEITLPNGPPSHANTFHTSITGALLSCFMTIAWQLWL